MSAEILEWEAGTLALGPAAVALGVFDGVHIGHQALIADAVARAAELDILSCVMTFDRDPDQVLTPDRAAPQLLTLEDKIKALQGLGLGAIVIVPFCRLVAEMAPDRFVSDVLSDTLRPVEVFVGRDFRFGRSASGNVTLLERYGGAHGFKVVARELLSVDGVPVTSTRIRQLVASGDVAAARDLLGRPHIVRGRVVHGRAAGRQLGTPTANVTPVKHAAIPANGVYSGCVRVGETRYSAGISVGSPPTFPEARDYLEAHLLDFEGDLYGAEIGLEFRERLRDQHAFDTPEALAQAIRGDIDRISGTVGDRGGERGPCE